MNARRTRDLAAAVTLGAILLAAPAFSQAAGKTVAEGPALFAGVDLGFEYALEVDRHSASDHGAWLLGASAKAFLPAGFGVGVSYFEAHHHDDPDRGGNFDSTSRAGMLDFLLQIGDWGDDSKEYISLHLGGLHDGLRGDLRDTANSYLIGGGIGATFISRREKRGMAVGAELRYLLAPEAGSATHLLQGLITIGFGVL